MMDSGKLFGRGLSFPPRIGADGRFAWSQGEPNIREAIRVILMTDQRERLMLPDFGGGLGLFLHEPNTVATRARVAERIQRSLVDWEPRITVESVGVEADPDDPQAAIATINYRLVATQSRERVSLTVTLSG
jgi:uncharacterized protein